jgi:hypothetical protein
MRHPLLWASLGLLLASCAAPRTGFVPPDGERLIGLALPAEDRPDPRLWRAAPGAVMSYTALPGLPGIKTPADVGSGTMHLDALMQRYPDSALMLGVYLVDQLDALARGDLDADIDRLIDLLAAYRRPVYLRFGYEFDGVWNRYEPAAYVAAWKRFRARLLSRGGARHIAMVWQSAGFCSNTYRGWPIEAWYPGDDQVDWIGMSYFFPNACGGLVAEGLVSFARRHRKPMMIAESTPRGYDLAGSRYSGDRKQFWPKTATEIWGEWYLPFFKFIERNADVVRAVAYINGHWESYPMWSAAQSPSYWGDSRLQTNAELLRRWQFETQGESWLWGGPLLFRQLGYE